jgi:uncharacterized protein YeeX (DUF496 family)
MSYTEKQIVAICSAMFNGLSPLIKIELIESLTKSLKKDKIEKVDDFYKSFGAFSNEKTAEEIVKEIKASRKFKNSEISF